MLHDFCLFQILCYVQEQLELWTDDLVCPLSGVGSSTNQIYRENGLRQEGHECEDRSFHYRSPLLIAIYTATDTDPGHRDPENTGWLKLIYPTRQNAISRQPFEIFIPKFLDLYGRDPATIVIFFKIKILYFSKVMAI